jgi:hypothetical protein
MQDLRDALAVITSMERKLGELREGLTKKDEVIEGLKKRNHRSVRFDEAIIAEHDKERGTRMKIDEPKTPYVREDPFSFPESADGEDVPVASGAHFIVGARKPRFVQPDHPSNDSESEAEVEDGAQDVVALPAQPSGQEHASRRPIQLDLQSLNQSLETPTRTDFDAARSKHYNEFQKLQQWRAKSTKDKQGTESDDGLEDDEDDEEASEA